MRVCLCLLVSHATTSCFSTFLLYDCITLDHYVPLYFPSCLEAEALDVASDAGKLRQTPARDWIVSIDNKLWANWSESDFCLYPDTGMLLCLKMAFRWRDVTNTWSVLIVDAVDCNLLFLSTNLVMIAFLRLLLQKLWRIQWTFLWELEDAMLSYEKVVSSAAPMGMGKCCDLEDVREVMSVFCCYWQGGPSLNSSQFHCLLSSGSRWCRHGGIENLLESKIWHWCGRGTVNEKSREQ